MFHKVDGNYRTQPGNFPTTVVGGGVGTL